MFFTHKKHPRGSRIHEIKELFPLKPSLESTQWQQKLEVPITIDMYFRKEVTPLCLVGETNILLNFPSLLLKKNWKEKIWRSFPKGFPFCQSTYWKKNCCTFLTVVTQNGSIYGFLSKDKVWVPTCLII